MARIQSGEVPDGSGDPLLPPEGPFLYKPGLSGGQIAYGGTIPGDDLEFHSGTVRDGLILFGASSAFDEANTRLGIGTIAPAAILHLTQSAQSITSRPISAANVGAPTFHWLGQDGGSLNLHQYVNDSSNSTYVTESSSTSGTGPIRFTLWTAGTIPFSGSPTITMHVVTRRYSNAAPAGTEQLQIDLKRAGGTVNVKTVLTGFLGTSFVDVATVLSAGEVSSLFGAGASDGSIEVSVVSLGSSLTGYDVAEVYLDISQGATANLARWDTSGAQSGRITVEGYLESQRLNLTGTSSGTVTFSGGTSPANHTYTVPTAQGAANTLLTNDGAGALSWATAATLGLAPSNATYITQTPNGTLTAEQALSALSTGILKSTTGTGVVSIAVGADLPAHNLLSAQHGDTAVQGATRGSLIVGNSTPAWDELVIGSTGSLLQSNGTDAAWATSLTGNLTFSGNIDFPPGASALTTFHVADASVAGDTWARLIDDTSTNTMDLAIDGVVFAGTSLQFPGAGGIVTTTAATQTLSNKTMSTNSTVLANTAASGFSFQDNTTSTKRLRMILSGSVGNNTFTLSNTAARNYGFGNIAGNVVVVGDDPPAVAAGALGKVDLTGQTAGIGSTNLSNTPPAGLYEVCVYVACTTASGAGAPTLDVNLAWTDVVGATNRNLTADPGATAFPLPLSATGRTQGRILVQLTSGDIAYTTTINAAAGTPQYAIYIRVKYLG